MNYPSGAAALNLALTQADDAPARPSVPELRVLPGGLETVRGNDTFAEDLVALRPSLTTRALQLTRNAVDAQDLVSETLLRALTFQASYQRGTHLRAWAQQVLYSVFASGCRRRTRERRAMAWLTEDPNAWTRPETPPETEHLSPALSRAVKSLPEHYRDVLRLVDLEELPYRDAAERLGIPVGTVMSRLFRARRLLAEALDGGSLGLASA